MPQIRNINLPQTHNNNALSNEEKSIQTLNEYRKKITTKFALGRKEISIETLDTLTSKLQDSNPTVKNAAQNTATALINMRTELSSNYLINSDKIEQYLTIIAGSAPIIGLSAYRLVIAIKNIEGGVFTSPQMPQHFENFLKRMNYSKFDNITDEAKIWLHECGINTKEIEEEKSDSHLESKDDSKIPLEMENLNKRNPQLIKTLIERNRNELRLRIISNQDLTELSNVVVECYPNTNELENTIRQNLLSISPNNLVIETVDLIFVKLQNDITIHQLPRDQLIFLMLCLDHKTSDAYSEYINASPHQIVIAIANHPIIKHQDNLQRYKIHQNQTIIQIQNWFNLTTIDQLYSEKVVLIDALYERFLILSINLLSTYNASFGVLDPQKVAISLIQLFCSNQILEDAFNLDINEDKLKTNFIKSMPISYQELNGKLDKSLPKEKFEALKALLTPEIECNKYSTLREKLSNTITEDELSIIIRGFEEFKLNVVKQHEPANKLIKVVIGRFVDFNNSYLIDYSIQNRIGKLQANPKLINCSHNIADWIEKINGNNGIKYLEVFQVSKQEIFEMNVGVPKNLKQLREFTAMNAYGVDIVEANPQMATYLSEHGVDKKIAKKIILIEKYNPQFVKNDLPNIEVSYNKLLMKKYEFDNDEVNLTLCMGKQVNCCLQVGLNGGHVVLQLKNNKLSNVGYYIITYENTIIAAIVATIVPEGIRFDNLSIKFIYDTPKYCEAFIELLKKFIAEYQKMFPHNIFILESPTYKESSNTMEIKKRLTGKEISIKLTPNHPGGKSRGFIKYETNNIQKIIPTAQPNILVGDTIIYSQAVQSCYHKLKNEYNNAFELIDFIEHSNNAIAILYHLSELDNEKMLATAHKYISIVKNNDHERLKYLINARFCGYYQDNILNMQDIESLTIEQLKSLNHENSCMMLYIGMTWENVLVMSEKIYNETNICDIENLDDNDTDYLNSIYQEIYCVLLMMPKEEMNQLLELPLELLDIANQHLDL